MNMIGYLLVMALTTYLIRALPLTVWRKKIKSRFLRSFLAYVPCACMAAMTFPAVLYSTNSVVSGGVGMVVAVILAIYNRSLIVVAMSGCGAVFLTELIMRLI